MCDLNAPLPETELAVVFPDANRLSIEIPSGPWDGDGDNLKPQKKFCAVLKGVAATSPALVTKLQALTLSFGTVSVDDTPSAFAGLANFLSRCSNLQELDVSWEDRLDCSNHARFKGEGSTPPEQRASMQRQLAALCDSITTFMAPESWPACGCLVSFTVRDFEDMTDISYLSAAARTLSLAHLVVHTYDGDICSMLSTVSSLQRLTSLELCSLSDRHVPLGGQVVAAIGQLSGLLQLELDLDLLPLDDAGTAAIPASWLALSSLTRVHLGDADDASNDPPLVSHVSRLVAVQDLRLQNVIVVGRLESLFELTRLTSLDGPNGFTEDDDVLGAEAGNSGKATQVPQQWRERLQRLTWRAWLGIDGVGSSASAMLAQLTSLVFLDLGYVCISPRLCRILAKLTRLTHLCLGPNADAAADFGEQEGESEAVEGVPALRAVQRIHLRELFSMVHMLACCIQIPATTDVGGDSRWRDLAQPQPLHIRGWQRGWLPAVLAAPRPGACAVVARDDGDVGHYLESAAAMGSREQQGASHVVWLGEEVTPTGFGCLLSCPQQPPLRLEVGTAVQSADTPQGRPCLTPTSAHFRALVGVSAPRLVSLVLAGCEYLTNRDVAMLAGSCLALKQLQLTGAWWLTDAALQSLSVGCRKLEQVQLTQARVTEEGVVVALTLLGELTELVLGDLPRSAMEQLQESVQREMPAADHLLWEVAMHYGAQHCIAWRRFGGQ